jgi:DNA polymerase (family X)
VNLARASNLADKMLARLSPLCVQAAVAGSIRRRRPEVGDIDLVLLPKPGQRPAIDGFFSSSAAWAPVKTGPQNCSYNLTLPADGALIQVDVFFARAEESDLLTTKPGNFGSLLLCRTGSKEHNIFMIERAKRLGKVWHPYEGVFARFIGGGERYLAGASEIGIFQALAMDFIAPEKRER